jgi:hypothetical protein
MTPASSDAMRPLSAGNVVSAAFKLYRAKFNDYFKISLWASVWILSAIVAAIVVTVIFSVSRNQGILWLLIPVLLAWFIYASVRYGANLAAISRLAFGELTNQPESIDSAQRFTRSRMWQFFWAGVLLSLIYSGIFFVGYLAIILIGGILFLLALGPSFASVFSGGQPDLGAANAGLTIAAVLVFLLLLLGLVAVFLWFAARFMVYDLPLAVESETTVSQSIGRSWRLSKGHAWRIVLILLIAVLVTLPFTILAQVLSGIAESAAQAIVRDGENSVLPLLAGLIGALMGVLLQILIQPFWQVIKAIIYYDLRSRREGLDLTLRDRPL